MAKSYNQYIKRLKRRHNLLTFHGDPICFSGLGYHNCRIEAGKIYDFQDSKAKLYLGNDQMGVEFPTHRVDGTRIFIEFIKPKLSIPNIGYRILTKVGWEY